MGDMTGCGVDPIKQPKDWTEYQATSPSPKKSLLELSLFLFDNADKVSSISPRHERVGEDDVFCVKERQRRTTELETGLDLDGLSR